MNRFIQKALEKVDKLQKPELVTLLKSVTNEYQLYDMVFDSMGDGIIVVDANFSIQTINKSAKRFLSISSKAIFNGPVWNLINESNLSNFIKTTLSSYDNVRDKEFVLTTPRGRRILSFSVMPMVSHKKIQGTIIYIQDVTEARELAVKLNRAERLASLTNLTANVAHEIKNPLAAISIHIQLIKKALDNNCCTKELIEKYLSIIDDEIHRLNQTIVDFLFSVKPINLDQKSDLINPIIEDILALVGEELKAKNIDFKFEPQEDLPLLFIDAKLIKQALLNVINNAVAAMSKTKRPFLYLKSYIENNYEVIKIQDNGCGIPESALNKIFEPYYTTKEDGSGLGLTIVYKIVQEHQGELQLDSIESKGTTFYIKLPIKNQQKFLAKLTQVNRES